MCDTEHVENRTNSYDIRSIMTKKYMDFNKLICDIGGKLLYIKSGSTGHTFKGIIYDNDGITEILNYAVKVVAYPIKENYGDVNDIKRPENAELMMLRVLSYFVVNGQSPHIVLPIGTFNTSIKPFIALAKNKIVENKKYDQFIKRYKQSEYHDNVSILISEWANCGDLLDYFRNNYHLMKLRHWRTIFFQIISVLAVIQNKYPGFRHNDLKANNILVQKIDFRKKNNYFLYKINMENNYYEYLVPNIGIQIKLWDFDFACIPGIVENSKVSSEWTDRINVKPEQNKYYDLHYFFNTFTKKGFFSEFWEAKEIHHTVKQFVREIVPEYYSKSDEDKCIITDRGRILINTEFTTPQKLLTTHPFFNKMRNSANKVN
jgi:serine/threonine protein kinase